MLHQSTKMRIYEKLVASLGRARQGKRELDIVVSFMLGDTTSETGKMVALLVEEGYPWDVISDLLDEDLPAYTSSLDAVLPGENVVLSAYSRKRRQWVAVHRTVDGAQISAWAATECLARRLAGLQARKSAAVQAANQRPTQAPRPAARKAPAAPVPPRPAAAPPHARPVRPAAPKPMAKRNTESGDEWRILF